MAAGLRERKKARTRRSISDTATRLFCEQGFERVTIAQIAEAADVSVKTIFNYFAAKEELFFDRADELLDGLLESVRARPAGTTVLAQLRRLMADQLVPVGDAGWAGLHEPYGYERFRAFVAAEYAAPALRAHRLMLAEAWAPQLAALFAAELDLGAEDPAATTMATMVLAAMGLRHRALAEAILARADPADVEARVRAVVDESFERLGRAFADIDRAAPTGNHEPTRT
jgi:AcrR family transcriptional regulator